MARSLAYRHSTEGTRHQYREAEPKTANSRRTIPLPDVALHALQEHRLKQKEERLRAPVWKNHELVFTNQYGGYLNQSILRHVVLRWILSRRRVFPWQAQAFLEDATSRILVRRAGGGYSFMHRLLLEYFARMDDGRAQRRGRHGDT